MRTREQLALNDEIRTRQKKRLVPSRSFERMLEETIHRYRNRAIETGEVIEKLIKLAKGLREIADRFSCSDRIPVFPEKSIRDF